MSTQRRLHHSSVALSMMRCSKYASHTRSVHVMNFSEKDPLLNFYAKFVVQLVQRGVEVNVALSPISEV